MRSWRWGPPDGISAFKNRDIEVYSFFSLSLSLSPPISLSPALPFFIYLYLSNPGKELSPETELAYLQVMTTYFSVT